VNAVQDVIAIAVSVAAGLWLVRTLWRQMSAPSCGTTQAPSGSDGFVPLGDLTRSARRADRATPE
jgi:hypothetical protein